MEQISKTEIIGFLKKPEKSNSRVFVKDNERIQFYMPDNNKLFYLEYKQSEINRNYLTKHASSKEKTKTLTDLKRQGFTANQAKVGSYIRDYENISKMKKLIIMTNYNYRRNEKI